MRHRESGIHNSSFDEFERAELRQLEAAMVNDMAAGFFDEGVSDDLKSEGLFEFQD